MSAQKWQPGDKAYVEVEVHHPAQFGDHVWITGPMLRDDEVRWVRPADLRPVPAAGEVEAATEDVIERVARVLAETVAPWDETPSIVRDSFTAQARALAAAGLLTGGVPGRSEAEIKAEGRARNADECRAFGWLPGTRLAGDEGYGETIIEITALGEQAIVAKQISHRGVPVKKHRRYEKNWTLAVRDWRVIPAAQVSDTEGQD